MADSISRTCALTQSKCDGPDGNGGSILTTRKYAEIIVVRHGETEWNVERRIQGQADVDLNDVGRQQAVVVADRLSREPKISAIYSSDLKRAFDTSETIAKGCGVLEVTKDPDLQERHLGDLQGVLFDETEKVNPEAHRAFKSDRDDQEIPGGGESRIQLYQRCTSALQRIAKKHIGERVVVVSHGATIEALDRRAYPYGQYRGVPNASVSVFHVSAEDEWSIKSWADVSHVNQTGFLPSGFGGDGNSG
ncbi:Phosphoglycerate mutase [Handroanthus impetiginosus]|uniref:Phosphoglycerate mutase n=1 Tax=Handroanthus impetiginosus TaxID=429701 RepID=A0A2G9GKA7_9LAMI|nr:Phosphoglycerate mutase [Handroanthus impetiginosus]